MHVAAFLVVLAAVATSARAQATTASACPAPVAQRDTAATPATVTAPAQLAAPDIVLFAAVSAREVTFRSQPQVVVRLCGGTDSVRVVERRNLPSPVAAGTTYRDVYVAVEIFGRFNARCLARETAGNPGGLSACVP